MANRSAKSFPKYDIIVNMSVKLDKMAAWPIGKLLFSMGIPAVFSMLIQAMYNVVDSVYISNYSQDALFAIGLASPLQMVGLSVALGGAVGVGTLISRRLGERNFQEAGAVATTGIIITIIHTVLIMLLGIFFARPFLSLFTSRMEIIDLGYDYLLICMGLCFGQMFSILFERILQAQGNMMFPMFAQLIGAVCNIVLDPVFIFGMGPIPEMGMSGAAVATVIGQIAGMIFIVLTVILGKHDVKFHFKGLKMEKDRLKDIYGVGLPTAVINMVASVTTTLMNGVLVLFSEYAVTALSIYFKLQSFVFMPVYGFNQGALPILSYTYGAGNAPRYAKTVKLYTLTASACMALGTLLFFFKPDFLLSFFAMDEALFAVSVNTLKIISLSFIPAAISIVVTTVFQSFGRGTISMVQSILRQLAVLVPLAYLLAQFGKLDIVWLAYPIAEILVVLIFIPMAYKTYRLHFGLNTKS